MPERGLNRLADLGDKHVIFAFCGPCDRSRKLITPQLVAMYGEQLGIDELKRRLTCSKCGDRPREIRITYAAPSR